MILDPLKSFLGIMIKIVGIKFGGNWDNFYFCGGKNNCFKDFLYKKTF